jgi:hypothetical protein
MHTHSPNRQKKFKQTLSACQMTTIFWGGKEVLMQESCQKGLQYRQNCIAKHQKTCLGSFRKNRRGMLTSGVELCRENVLPHISARIRALLEHLNWELLDHPPYSPDLAPSHYKLFI